MNGLAKVKVEILRSFKLVNSILSFFVDFVALYRFSRFLPLNVDLC